MGEMTRFRAAALTMVRNDEFFLRKWVEYYSRELGPANLYVYLDGEDQAVPDFCKDINIEVLPHKQERIDKADRARAEFLSEKASKLLSNGYGAVIGTDVDEFLIVDPELGKGLNEFLSENADKPCLSGLGIDVGQNLNSEKELDEEATILSQRHYAKLSTRYTKASVMFKPGVWGSGFHRMKGRNFHIASGLYLFHFGCVDLERIKAKMSDKILSESGWQRHLNKRTRTITRISKARKIHDWKATEKARRCQSLIRPPYAWNKPAMFELVIIVEIPERLRSII